MGTVAEAVRQSVRGGEVDGGGGADSRSKKHGGKVKQYVVSDANAERLAESLCRMRGAALKLGQMLSIQARTVLEYNPCRSICDVTAYASCILESYLMDV